VQEKPQYQIYWEEYGSADGEPVMFMHGGPGRLLSCPTCGLLTRDEDATARYEADVYDRELMSYLYPRYLQAFAEKTWYKPLLGDHAEILEVGSHLGAFLQTAEQWGWRPIGLDIGASTSDFARSKGMSVKRLSLEDYLPPLRPEAANTPKWRRAEIPAANGHGNARSVAQVLGVLACGGAENGVRLLREETLRDAIVEQYYGKDLVLGRTFRWGSGFMLTSDVLPLGPNPRCFGHGGWGGSLGIADADGRVAWAYVMNKMSPGTTGDSRAAQMLAALYSAR